MNIAAIVAAVAFATGFGAAWQWQGGNIAKIQLEQRDERIARDSATRATYERYSAAVSKAQADAQVRRTAISAAVDSNGAGLIGLRLTASTVRASAATDDARTAYADTISELFGVCSETLVRVAGEADNWVSEVITLQSAWPKP